MSEERKGQPWDAYMREHGEEEYAMSDTEKWLAVLRNNRERWPSVSLAMVDQDRLLAELDARDAEIATADETYAVVDKQLTEERDENSELQRKLNVVQQRAEKAEAERDAAQKRIAELEAALPKIRASITQTLGGMDRGSAIWSNEPYDKGMCNGVTMALTAFDHEAAALAAVKEKA